MKITQKSFNQNLNNKFFFEKSPLIAVAVSGGPDSMSLVFLLHNWIRKKKGNLIALIIDHQIRKNSNQEAQSVNKYLFNHQIKSKILRVNKKNVNKMNMIEARKNRFEKLTNYCQKNHILHLFLAHHYDDNLETFLLRKIAGSNIEGLRSIQNKTIINKLQIIRPLLSYEKKNILDYNKIQKIKYINDPSNLKEKYTRVIVRNFLKKNKKLKKEVKNDYEIIREHYSLYKKMIFYFLNKSVISFHNRKVLISTEKFLKQDREVQCKIIDILYKYLNPKQDFLRYKKIVYFLSILKTNKNFKVNLAGMSIKKDEISIIFSL